MKKPALIILILLVLAAVGAAIFLLFPRDNDGGTIARITLDGAVVAEIDLSRQTAPDTMTVKGKSGLTNTILVEPGRIRGDKADCPDQICVHQGFIDNGTVPIVCLPNKLIIEITGGGDGLDAATG